MIKVAKKIGWADGEFVYLEPTASYGAAQQMLRDQGETLPSPESLRRWVKQARIDAGMETGPSTQELSEIKVLRKEVADQQRKQLQRSGGAAYFVNITNQGPGGGMHNLQGGGLT